MKTDAQLKVDVISELDWNPAVDADEVSVAVKDGVVALLGHVRSYAAKCAIERAVQRVAGIRELAIELDVKLEPGDQRNDAEIAAALESAFKWHALIPAECLRVKVEGGFVTLEGEVDWEFQRGKAEKAAGLLTGVRGVINKIQLRHQPSTVGIGEGIRDALVRHAHGEARQIEVLLDGDTVTLQGRVDTWSERMAAQGAAWSAPGVKKVINQIMVGA